MTVTDGSESASAPRAGDRLGGWKSCRRPRAVVIAEIEAEATLRERRRALEAALAREAELTLRDARERLPAQPRRRVVPSFAAKRRSRAFNAAMRQYRASTAWGRMRRRAIERADGRCQASERLDDLVVLCWPDHKLVHEREQKGMALQEATMSVLAEEALSDA